MTFRWVHACAFAWALFIERKEGGDEEVHPTVAKVPDSSERDLYG